MIGLNEIGFGILFSSYWIIYIYLVYRMNKGLEGWAKNR